jgi:hypothetical protein
VGFTTKISHANLYLDGILIRQPLIGHYPLGHKPEVLQEQRGIGIALFFFPSSLSLCHRIGSRGQTLQSARFGHPAHDTKVTRQSTLPTCQPRESCAALHMPWRYFFSGPNPIDLLADDTPARTWYHVVSRRRECFIQ